MVSPRGHVKDLERVAKQYSMRSPESLARLIQIAGVKYIDKIGLEEFLRSSLKPKTADMEELHDQAIS